MYLNRATGVIQFYAFLEKKRAKKLLVSKERAKTYFLRFPPDIAGAVAPAPAPVRAILAEIGFSINA